MTHETIRYIILGLVLTVVITAQSYIMYLTVDQNAAMKHMCTRAIDYTNSYKLYNPDNEEETIVNGVYFSEGYYCVRTENMDWDDIKMTDYHEMCHAYTKTDWQHFCNGSNQTSWNVEDYLG